MQKSFLKYTFDKTLTSFISSFHQLTLEHLDQSLDQVHYVVDFNQLIVCFVSHDLQMCDETKVVLNGTPSRYTRLSDENPSP